MSTKKNNNQKVNIELTGIPDEMFLRRLLKTEEMMKGLKIDFSTGKALFMKLHMAGKYSLTSFKKDWPIPEITFPNQIRVKTRMGGICASDFHMMMLDISYFASILVSPENPSPMGHELVGDVVETGHEVSRLRIGTGLHICQLQPVMHMDSAPARLAREATWKAV